MAELKIRPPDSARWDLVALGEVMLRLDPADGRIATARSFRVWEGGGEYNVARGLARAFGMRAALVSALADNAVGRLLEDLIRQGGVDQSHVRWVPFDGVGRDVRNGLNFVERGFGVRAALGVSDRGHSAASLLKPADVDWDAIFAGERARWFHTGGIFAALSATTPAVAKEAMQAARRNDVVVSYDLNYRPSLWKANGGAPRAAEVNRELVGLADVLFGNEEDFEAALGFAVEGADASLSALDARKYAAMIERVAGAFPNLAVITTTLRVAKTATLNDWGALCWMGGRLYESAHREGLEIYDRIGGGDSFASGVIYALLQGLGPQAAVEYGAAHGALAMTTPGDTSMATLAEVEAVMRGAGARISR
jgi:2-dehydro-3-deoxygluconokinase